MRYVGDYLLFACCYRVCRFVWLGGLFRLVCGGCFGCGAASHAQLGFTSLFAVVCMLRWFCDFVDDAV